MKWNERRPPSPPVRIQPIAFPVSEEVSSWLNRKYDETMRATAKLALPETRPEVLYHYTDARGLVGIVSNQKFWLSHAWFLNDKTEVSHGSEAVAAKLRDIAGDQGSETVLRDVVGASLMSWQTRDLAVDPLVACFSESGDLDTQWTRYAHTQGFSVGLNISDIPDNHMGLRKVIYQPDEQASVIAQVINVYRGAAAECMSQFGQKVARACIPAFASWLLSSLLFHSIAFKSMDSESEQEWRIVFMKPRAGVSTATVPRHDLLFRVTERGIVPYLELPLLADSGAYEGRLPIGQIFVGKAEDIDLTINGLVRLLRDRGYNSSSTSIHPSTQALPGADGKHLQW